MRKIKLKVVLESLGDEIIYLIGSTDRIITHPAPIHEAESDLSITFCNKIVSDAQNLIRSTKAGVILCTDDQSLNKLINTGKTFIVVKNPRLSFLRLVKAIFDEPTQHGIHPTAIIDSKAKIHSDTYIGPFTYIGKCEIGEGTVIYGHNYIYSKTRIGRNVIIHGGTVIGADGFGYQRNEINELEKFPHIGGVIIEDNVEIGANTCIDRGTLSDTIIHEGTKIDNLVHIAHNVVIGRHTVVIAQAMVGGGTRVGDYAWVAPCACLRNKISIGNKATVGLGAVVVKDVSEGVTVMGVPACPEKEYKKYLKKLRSTKT